MQLMKKASFISVNIRELSLKLLIIIIGNFFCAVTYNGFFIPNNLLSGGVGGISIMVYYLTKIPTGLTVFLINVPIFLIGVKILDKKFAAYSFISMLALSFWLGITKDIGVYLQLNDILLSSIFGGILNGLGMGLLFRNRLSQGGMDIIAAIFKKKYNINVGTGLMCFNTAIVGLSSILFGLKPAMYTIISMYIGYQIVDKVQYGLNGKKNVIIVSDKAEEIAQAIINEIHRGVTFFKGEGGYSKNNKKVIYCIMTSTQIAKLKDIVDSVDTNAFMTVNTTLEVKGYGFKNVGI